MITGCVVFGKFHVWELLPILSLWKLQKKVTMQSLRLRSGELCFPFFRADYPHKLYGIPYGRFVFSPTIIYLLNHYQSSINISMESNVGFFFFFFGCLCYLALLLCSKLILYLPSSVLKTTISQGCLDHFTGEWF